MWMWRMNKIWKYTYARLLGRCAPIFYFNCDNVLFVYIVKQNKKKSRISSKHFMDFQNFNSLMKLKFWWRQIFEILIIHKPSLGLRNVPHKIWAWSVQPFWRLLDTNRQTPKHPRRQAKFIYRYIHYITCWMWRMKDELDMEVYILYTLCNTNTI